MENFNCTTPQVEEEQRLYENLRNWDDEIINQKMEDLGIPNVKLTSKRKYILGMIDTLADINTKKFFLRNSDFMEIAKISKTPFVETIKYFSKLGIIKRESGVRGKASQYKFNEKNLKKLSKKLGITYDNSQKNGNLYIALKDLGIKGFSKGGMVSELQKVATANGDEAWTTVKRGEDILTPLQSKVFNEEFIPRMDLMMDSAKVLDNIVKNSYFVGNVRNQSPINVEQNITLDLKEVNDPKTLVRFVQTDPTFKKVLSSVTIDQLGNSSRLDVNKYR